MHNLISFNELAFSYQNESRLRETENNEVNDYFECLTECNDTAQVCKRICRRLLIT
jgi:hypothetical protein